MSVILTTDSSNYPNADPANFRTQLSPALQAPPHAELALVSAQIWYSIDNIAAKYNNNQFRYFDGTDYQIITIPDGIYQFTQINSYIQGEMKTNSDYDVANDEPYIALTPNISTLRARIEFTQAAVVKGIKVDFAHGELRDILGFDAVEFDATAEGTRKVDITRGVNSIQIHLDIISGSIESGRADNVIWSFSPNTIPGALMVIEPRTRVYLPVPINYISSFGVYLTDQMGRAIDVGGETTAYTFHMRTNASLQQQENTDAVTELTNTLSAAFNRDRQ
ncbi:MAG: hypothetical protein WDA28_12835 [Castellaniella sp.]